MFVSMGARHLEPVDKQSAEEITHGSALHRSGFGVLQFPHARVAGRRRRDVGDGPRVHDVVRVGRIFEKVEPEQQRDERALPARLEVARLQKEPPSVLWRCR
jgi:hypothetical protein